MHDATRKVCLQGFQSMTQACGMLELSDSRDAYLTSLCGHTLTDTSTLDHTHASKAEGVMSPTGKFYVHHTDAQFHLLQHCS